MASGQTTPQHFVVLDMSSPLRQAGLFEDDDVQQVFLTRGDGKLYVVLDTGAVGNLCGDRWAQRVAAAAVRHRHRPSQQKLKKTLEVGSVGNGTQKAFLGSYIANGYAHRERCEHPAHVCSHGRWLGFPLPVGLELVDI